MISTTLWPSFFRTGLLPHVNAAPDFSDVSESFDFREAMTFIVNTEERFADLPAKIRKRFGNDPARLMDFLAEPDNADEAIRMGLIEAPRTSPSLDVTGTTDTKSVSNPASSEAEQKPGA